MYHQVRLNNLCCMSLLLIIICLVCEIRNDILRAAHSDAVSALAEPEFPAPKKDPPPDLKRPLSPNTQMMADAIEKSGFVKGENEMVNVFEWTDHITKDKKVTVVMTLPSGVNKNDCEIKLTSGDDSGVSSECVIKVPWSSRFLDGKSIFWSSDAKDDYVKNPETIEYEKSLYKFRIKDSHIPNAIYTMQLPIPVQTNPMTISSIERSFNPVFGGNKNNPRQKVLILRFTGIRDNFAAKPTLVGTTYESD